MVDALMRRRGLAEAVAKRRPHERAFVLDGVPVELFLVRRDESGCYTELPRRRHAWPPETFTPDGVASAAALTGVAPVTKLYLPPDSGSRRETRGAASARAGATNR